MRTFFRKIVHAPLLLLLLLLLFSACVQEDDWSAPESTKTLFFYMPWSTNLTNDFVSNLSEMQKAIQQHGLNNTRVIVYFSKSATEGVLFEMTDNKLNPRILLKTYDSPTYSDSKWVTSVLSDVKQYAPADIYSMAVGCHGMGWLPIGTRISTSTRSRSKRSTPDYPILLTRYFGGLKPSLQINISDFVKGVKDAGMHFQFLLFDDCYMQGMEVAYSLRNITDYLVASTCEIMAYGMPYEKIGGYLLDKEPNYNAICDAFYEFYSKYSSPYGTISVIDCRTMDNMAELMKRINSVSVWNPTLLSSLQRLDGYNPVIFFDFGDYVSHLCKDEALLKEFYRQLDLTIPFKRNTSNYYSMSMGVIRLNTYSGATISTPTESNFNNNGPKRYVKDTEWYKATH